MMASDKATRKRKNVKSDSKSKAKAASNGTKKASTPASKTSGGVPWWQFLLGLTLVCGAALVAAIALDVISVDDITENPLWIQTRDMVNEAIGNAPPSAPATPNKAKEPPAPPPDKIKETPLPEQAKENPPSGKGKRSPPPVEKIPPSEEAKKTPPLEKTKKPPPTKKNEKAPPPPETEQSPPPVKKTPPPEESKKSPPAEKAPPPVKTEQSPPPVKKTPPPEESKKTPPAEEKTEKAPPPKKTEHSTPPVKETPPPGKPEKISPPEETKQSPPPVKKTPPPPEKTKQQPPTEKIEKTKQSPHPVKKTTPPEETKQTSPQEKTEKTPPQEITKQPPPPAEKTPPSEGTKKTTPQEKTEKTPPLEKSKQSPPPAKKSPPPKEAIQEPSTEKTEETLKDKKVNEAPPPKKLPPTDKADTPPLKKAEKNVKDATTIETAKGASPAGESKDTPTKDTSSEKKEKTSQDSSTKTKPNDKPTGRSTPEKAKEAPNHEKAEKAPPLKKAKESPTPKKAEEAPTPIKKAKEAPPIKKAKEAPPPEKVKEDPPPKETPPQAKKTKEASPPTEAKKRVPAKESEDADDTEPSPLKAEESKKEVAPDSPDQTARSTADKPTEQELKGSSDPFINAQDLELIDEIYAADELLKQKETDRGLRTFEKLLQKHQTSPRVRYGRAQAMDQLAEEERSNELLQGSITAYAEVAGGKDCPPALKIAAIRRQANRLSFLGKTKAASELLQSLSDEFPDDIEVMKELGVVLLIMGENEAAKPYFVKAIDANPDDGFSKVHLGFIHRRMENYEDAITFLEAGIASGEEGTDEGKFFFNLGDSYLRTGKPDEARRVYEDATRRGLFLSPVQRSLYNVDTLHGQPWWTPEEAKFEAAVRELESNWEVIRDEALSLMDKETKLFQQEDESLRHTGDWKQYVLFSRGSKHDQSCKKTPKTCKIIEAIPESAGCKRGQVKFSVMHPGTHVWPHTGPTNCRLRAHLGLIIPGGSRIRVVNETRVWEEGKVFIFDDSFEHEVWQEAETYRMVLIVDLWHPELTKQQRKYLSAI